MNTPKILLLTILNILLLVGCGENDNNSKTVPPSNKSTTITAVDGYIKDATVTDSVGQKASYTSNGKYTFASSPVYPLKLSGGKLEDTNINFDINMTAQNGSTIISPISTFLGNDSNLLSKFANLGLNKSTIDEFNSDYINTNDTNLSKLSQLLYTILRDSNLTETFKTSVKNNNSLGSLDNLFTLAKLDINNSSTLGKDEKLYSQALIEKVKSFNNNPSAMENHIKTQKEALTFISEHGNPFITVWETNSSDSNITIPTLANTYKYNYIVDWGDGNIEQNISGNISHTYRVDGNHTVKIYGDFPTIYFNDDYANPSANTLQVKAISDWGDVKWKSMNKSFKGCSNLELTATDTPNLTQVSSLNYMFSQIKKVNSSISNWDVSNITRMSYTFSYLSDFNQPLNDWNTSKVIEMSGMFDRSTKFNQPLNNWDVSNVTSTKSMFYGVADFNQPLNDWNTSKIYNMTRMFFSARSFNQPLNNWDTSNVRNMQQLFSYSKKFNQNINNWNTSKVTNMSFVFSYTDDFNQPINDWNVSNVITMNGMFEHSQGFNQSLSNWDVSNVTNMNRMFSNTSNFNQNISNWDVSNVTDMGNTNYYDAGMFENATAFSNQNLSSWNVNNVINHTDFMTGSGSGNVEPIW